MPQVGPSAVIQFCSAVHLTVSCSIIIFGIGVPPIWQGLVGVVTALEGHFGIVQSNLDRVLIFLAGLGVNTALAVSLGYLALKPSTYSDCTSQFEGVAVRKEQNFTFTFDGIVADCETSYRMYAFVQFGTAVISFFCLMLSALAYLSLVRGTRRRRNDAETYLFTS